MDISLNYSKAVIESSESIGEIEKKYEELVLFYDFCTANTDLYKYLTSLFYDKRKIKEMLLYICSILKLSKLTTRLLLMCLENNRIEYINAIILDIKLHLDLMNNIKNADVYSAKSLSNDEMQNIKTNLDSKFASNFRLKNIIDESLLGGVKIFFDNKIIDISVLGILNYYKKCLMKGS